MADNCKEHLLEGLYDRLGRAVNRDETYRKFLINELTIVIGHGASIV